MSLETFGSIYIVILFYAGTVAGIWVRMKHQSIDKKGIYSIVTPFVLIGLNIYIFFGLAYYRPNETLKYIVFAIAGFPVCIALIIELLAEVQAYNKVAEKMSLRKHKVSKSIFFLYTDYMMKEQEF